MSKRWLYASVWLIVPVVGQAQSLDLVNGVGLSIGNSPNWTGVRINWRDKRVQEVTGLNVTIWKPIRNPDFEMNGIALGVFGPNARDINGAALGVGGVVANHDINGIAIAGLGVVAEGDING